MKLVFLIYDSGIDEEMVNLLNDLGTPYYTKIFNAQGVGGTGKKFNNPVFPGENNIMLVGMEEEKINPLKEKIKTLKSKFKINPGITIFAVESKEII